MEGQEDGSPGPHSLGTSGRMEELLAFISQFFFFLINLIRAFSFHTFCFCFPDWHCFSVFQLPLNPLHLPRINIQYIQYRLMTRSLVTKHGSRKTERLLYQFKFNYLISLISESHPEWRREGPALLRSQWWWSERSGLSVSEVSWGSGWKLSSLDDQSSSVSHTVCTQISGWDTKVTQDEKLQPSFHSVALQETELFSLSQ